MQKNKWNLLLGIFITTPTWASGPERIITLNPMVAEWTAEILGDHDTRKKIIASSEYSNYPEHLKKIPTIGPYPNVQIEKIASLKPDLVIGSTEYNRPDQLDRLKTLGLNIQTLPKEKFRSMDQWIKTLGNILGETDRIKLAIQKWDDSLKKLQKKNIKRKTVFYLVQNQPLITAGRESFINDVFENVGFDNVFKNLNQSYPQVSKEAVLEKKPELILYFEMTKNPDEWENVKNNWKNSRIIPLNGDDFSRCSVRMLKAVEKLVHE